MTPVVPAVVVLCVVGQSVRCEDGLRDYDKAVARRLTHGLGDVVADLADIGAPLLCFLSQAGHELRSRPLGKLLARDAGSGLLWQSHAA